MYLAVANKKVYAYTAGRLFDAARPTVVFIHGAASDHSVWVLQSRYFAYHGWNVLAVDLPGHGKSEGAALDAIPEAAKWVTGLLDAAGAGTAALVGHSMGSLIVIEAASQAPGRVTKIALVATAVPMPVSEPLLAASRTNDHVAYEMINVFGHSGSAQIGGNRVPGMWMMGSSMRLMERCGAGTLFADFTACNNYATGLAAAESVKCPALLVLGQRDQMTPAKATKDLAANLAGSRTVILEGAGHSLMSERPDEVLDNLIAFLDAGRAV
jgi:pimeloyl-ACP methyl ester carboxylesterase